MTNQASEQVMKEITKILLMYKARLAYEQVEPQHEWLGSIDIEEAKLDLLAIVRTEKLKLLDEVRERVVGEDEDTQKWEDPIDRQVADECNQLRAEMRTILTKLEAEL